MREEWRALTAVSLAVCERTEPFKYWLFSPLGNWLRAEYAGEHRTSSALLCLWTRGLHIPW